MTSQSYEKKWKYLSIVLMGIIATGILAPRAFAANPTLEEVLAVVMGIDTKVDALVAMSARGHCVTIDVNRNGQIDRFEISPRPHDGVNHAGCDLRGADLTGIDLSFSDLSGADLAGAIVHGAGFFGADLSNADLTGIGGSTAGFQSANLSNADLAGAILGTVVTSEFIRPPASFQDANLDGADFTGAHITDVDFTGCTGTPIGLDPNPCTP